MAAELHILDQRRLIDANGIADGASIYFYTTGTLTLASIYEDEQLTTPLANPVVVSAGAAVPYIYLDSDVTYRRRIVYTDGTVDDLDPYAAGVAIDGATAAFVGLGTGAVPTTVQERLRETYSLMDFIPDNLRAGVKDRTGTTDLRTYIQAAIDAIDAAGGGTLYIPAGTYKCLGTVNLCYNLTIQGAGREVSILDMTGVAGTTIADGTLLRLESPINASTGVDVYVRDLQLKNDTTTNVGAGFYDTCGTYIGIDNCSFRGFKWGVVFDQTEVSWIKHCHFSPQRANGACIWLVNGAENNPSILGGFTNRITIEDNQFNPGNTGSPWAVIDDGGYLHQYRNNNINGGGFRVAGVFGLTIEGGEWESVVGKAPISFTSTTYYGGYGAGGSTGTIKDNFFAPVSGQPGIKILSAGNLSIESNMFSVIPHASVNACIHGAAQAANIFDNDCNSSAYSEVPLFDGVATRHVSSIVVPLAGDATTAMTLTEYFLGKVLFLIGNDTTHDPITLTIPADADLDALPGTRVEVMASEHGLVSITGATGVYISGLGNEDIQPTWRLKGKHARVILEKQGDNFWIIYGTGLLPPTTTEASTSSAPTQATINTVLSFTNGSAITHTIPPQSTTFRVATGAGYKIRQMGAGQVTLAPGAGVTLRSEGGKLKTAGQYAEVELTHLGSDEWLITGNRSA